MKALVYRRFGPPEVLRLEDIPKPEPRAKEVLVKVHAASLNPLDWRLLSGGPPPLPWLLSLKGGIKRIGRDFAGVVEAVGAEVKQWKPGDAVFGAGHGGFAEYTCVAENRVIAKPDGVTFEQAAAIPVAGLSALQALRDYGKLQAGQAVLINGAAGGVGTFAVQLARVMGARVHGVCSTRNVEMVRSLGAERVFDYTCEDFTATGDRYDLILDNIGNHPFGVLRQKLTPSGAYVGVGGPKEMSKMAAGMFAAMWLSARHKNHRVLMAKMSHADLAYIAELIATGRLTPVISDRFPLRRGVEAVQLSAGGHASGKVIIYMDEASA